MNTGNPLGPVAKIKVDAAGEIWFDGTPTTLEGLGPVLAELRSRNGVVWYHRAAPGADPAPEAMAVIQLVVEHRLPISLSLRPDFSDVVRPDGSVSSRRGPNTLS